MLRSSGILFDLKRLQTFPSPRGKKEEVKNLKSNAICLAINVALDLGEMRASGS